MGTTSTDDGTPTDRAALLEHLEVSVGDRPGQPESERPIDVQAESTQDDVPAGELEDLGPPRRILAAEDERMGDGIACPRHRDPFDQRGTVHPPSVTDDSTSPPECFVTDRSPPNTPMTSTPSLRRAAR